MAGDNLLQLALDHHRSGSLQQAELIYREILAENPDDIDALHLLGVLLHRLGKLDSAITYIKRALQLDPEFAEAYNNLGNAIRDKGPLEEAEIYYQQALKIDPNFAEAYNNLGNIYIETDEPDKAEDLFKRALQIKPDFAEAYNNLGTILGARNHLDKSIGYFRKALQIKPDFADAHWNLSHVLLLSGNLNEGWKEYEWRWQTKDFPSRRNNFTLPVWEGSSLEGKVIYVYEEQGVGDEIMFQSCLPEVIAQAKLCIVECRKRLVPLLSRSFPDARIIRRDINSEHYPAHLPKADFKIAIGSLPNLLRPHLTSFPQRISYFIPDNYRSENWRNRFKQLGEGMKIGISWRGGKYPKVKRIRSVPLEQWELLLSIPDIHFVNLQYGDSSSELIEVNKRFGIRIYDWEDADPLKDLDNFAAQIAALDLVISIDNSTVHMAGALGKSIWTLLPFSPDWRWMLNREDSPWYPTMRLFRQSLPGDWESVIVKVKDELLKLLKKT
jgi:Tfp pilus assembly protein PilF